MLLNEFFGNYDPAGQKKSEERNKRKYDENELAELVYEFILNNDKLHKQEFIPLAQRVHKHPTSEHHAKMWLPLVNKGCMEFYHHHKMTEDPKDLFHAKFRKSMCEKIANECVKQILRGDYQLGE